LHVIVTSTKEKVGGIYTNPVIAAVEHPQIPIRVWVFVEIHPAVNFLFTIMRSRIPVRISTASRAMAGNFPAVPINAQVNVPEIRNLFPL
jgi:hypothetical protein